jgi:hypothetical protein
MPYRSKGCSPWSSRFGIGPGAKYPITENFTVTKSPEPEVTIEEAKTYKGLYRQRLNRRCPYHRYSAVANCLIPYWIKVCLDLNK